MERKIYKRLLKWKQEEKGAVALLIDGARRVGKSYIVEEFAKREYKSYILIDFARAEDEVKNFFLNYKNDYDGLFRSLSLYFRTKLYERDSLIIFDEVQFFPQARAAIKYLVADRRYDYIETGSLVSINSNVADIMIPSEERRIKMYPMDFEEFLWAMGDDMLMPYIKECFENKKPLGEALHRRATDYFRQYLIVGGMPQAVAEYAESKSFERADTKKRDILNLYRADIRKYAKGFESKVVKIFDTLPGQLQKHEKKFRLSALKERARFRDYESSFLWLEDSMIVNICYAASEPGAGLRLRQEDSSFKCYMGDTGLLVSMAFDETETEKEEIFRKLMLSKLEINEGMLVENIVAQMLVASGHLLYFFSNYSKNDSSQTMEIDFLIRKNNVTSRHNISPIEVKSTKNYTTVSLNKFMTKYSKALSTPFIIHTGDLRFDGGIVYLPMYMTPLL
ncbi:MAG: ATP-binding protein [Bacteroidales bacterium]|nr:ATP-binding protein [Bacteroidales bacterium]